MIQGQGRIPELHTQGYTRRSVHYTCTKRVTTICLDCDLFSCCSGNKHDRFSLCAFFGCHCHHDNPARGCVRQSMRICICVICMRNKGTLVRRVGMHLYCFCRRGSRILVTISRANDQKFDHGAGAGNE